MSDNSSNGAVGFVMSLRDKLPDAMFPAAIPLKGDVCWQIAIGLVVLQEILWVLASGYFTCILMILVSILGVYVSLLALKRMKEGAAAFVPWVITATLALSAFNVFYGCYLMLFIGDIADLEAQAAAAEAQLMALGG